MIKAYFAGIFIIFIFFKIIVTVEHHNTGYNHVHFFIAEYLFRP